MLGVNYPSALPAGEILAKVRNSAKIDYGYAHYFSKNKKLSAFSAGFKYTE
jgi:hypothetical protein